MQYHVLITEKGDCAAITNTGDAMLEDWKRVYGGTVVAVDATSIDEAEVNAKRRIKRD